jgi:hypothetical protein
MVSGGPTTWLSESGGGFAGGESGGGFAGGGGGGGEPGRNAGGIAGA